MVTEFLFENRFVILFYSIIVLLVYLNRKKFEIQLNIIALYKTKIGLKLMNSVGKKHRELVKIFGLIGIGIGFIVMFYMSYTLVKNLYDLLTIPDAQTAISLVFPGVKIPGSPIFIPLIQGWIVLFLVIAVHEFSHGIVAIAHNIKIKSSGIFFLGPLMGAFVEPDEKQLKKKSDAVKYSVFAAGPLSNIVLALVAVVVLLFVINPIMDNIPEPVGFTIDEVVEGYPAEAAGIKPGIIINKWDGVTIETNKQLVELINELKPSQLIILSTNTQTYSVTTTEHPEEPERGYIGIQFSRSKTLLSSIFMFFREFIGLIVLLSLGIGVANLLPLGIADGGRMLQIALQKTSGIKKGNNIWKNISLLCFILLIINVVLGMIL